MQTTRHEGERRTGTGQCVCREAGSKGDAERRGEPRRNVAAGVKLCREDGGRFVAGRSRDMSGGGCLVEVVPDRPVRVGERVRVGIDEPGTGVVREASFAAGVVVRVEEVGARAQRVAVRYDRGTESVLRAA